MTHAPGGRAQAQDAHERHRHGRDAERNPREAGLADAGAHEADHLVLGIHAAIGQDDAQQQGERQDDEQKLRQAIKHDQEQGVRRLLPARGLAEVLHEARNHRHGKQDQRDHGSGLQHLSCKIAKYDQLPVTSSRTRVGTLSQIFQAILW